MLLIPPTLPARVLRWLTPIFLAGFAFRLVAAEPGAGFSYGTLLTKARDLAASEYRPETRPELPEELKKLSYDDYQTIHFVGSEGPWHGESLRFSFQFFHRGFLYEDPVAMHLIEDGQVHDFPFSPKQFNYGKIHFATPLSADLQFAGLRVLYPLNSTNKQDEVAAFLGASYFRLIGAHQRYGVSARAVAIDTAEPTGEEFPRFTQFWIQKPGSLESAVRFYALLDGPSVAGAYQFDLRPGDITQVEVQETLFFRKPVKKLGLAPATSMFLVGENRTRFVPDFRPEIHDSDGLLIEPDGADSLFRPLVNPEKEHVVSRFPVRKLKGFGLLQRDRQFDHYQDLVGRYELRPGLWVEPKQSWGTGAVELVEIPTPGEWNDNIVAYWVGSQPAARGQELHFSYRLSACVDAPEKPGLLFVEATRLTPQHDKIPTRFVIDFAARNGKAPAADAALETTVETTHGNIRNVVSEKNEVTGGWRTFFDLADPGSKPVELKAFLHRGVEVLSETWAYHYELP
jgi:periplasmic glucans biosynthesis protein